NKQKVKEAMVWECLFYVIRICIHSLRPKPLISKSTEIQIFTKLFIVKSYINTDAYIKSYHANNDICLPLSEGLNVIHLSFLMCCCDAQTYRLDETIQVVHLKRVWVHMIEVFKLFQQSLVVHGLACTDTNMSLNTS
uniref:Uncharacterized protein n=1 Tax=Oryzias latipes TaxID=8090 RepID=A0A3B3HJR8_ORYLA